MPDRRKGLVHGFRRTGHRAGFRTRVDDNGIPVQLEHQDRRRWDRTPIEHGLGMLDRAFDLARPLGPYSLQAAISGCHAHATTFGDTDWVAILALYDALVQLTARYHLLGAVRGDFLTRLGRHHDAAAELERAAELAPTRQERHLLLDRMAAALAAAG
ncbi:DUF6596 domain-containing protein [Nocardia nova]|uniref:DUF6596 domain-containing protein n=1 Tax=Nocardia nova TaxID=37330 RepID=UPI00280ADCC3|nr:DUF6596 domain-containing protein [Nocardia nova]